MLALTLSVETFVKAAYICIIISMLKSPISVTELLGLITNCSHHSGEQQFRLTVNVIEESHG